MAGNNSVHRGQQRDKPFRDALRMEIAAAGDDLKALRSIARAQIAAAIEGDFQAAQFIADRLDGKPAQEQHVNVTDERERMSDAELRAFIAAAIVGTVFDSGGTAKPDDPKQLN
jgi:hypothetical protein